MFCRDLPGAAKAAGIDALIVDQMEPAGGAVAEYLGMPFVTVCNALALNTDPIVPPAFTPWRYRPTPLARIRNAVGHAASDWATRPITRVVADYRTRWGLRRLAGPDDSYSQRARPERFGERGDCFGRNGGGSRPPGLDSDCVKGSRRPVPVTFVALWSDFSSVLDLVRAGVNGCNLMTRIT
jgi:hypothetical protein